MAKICCLILNYNNAKTTIELLERIKDYSIFSKILVVDNCSTDNSYDTLLSLSGYDNLIIIRSTYNGGYGAGNNLGMRYAFEQLNARYVLICNPDVFFSQEVVFRLVDVMNKNSNCLASSCVQRDSFNNDILEKAWKIPSALGYALTFSYTFAQKIAQIYYESKYFENKEIIVDCIPGAMLMVRTQDFIKIGGYDEKMFLYAEEDLLGYKVKKSGFNTILVNDCYYIHAHGSSINKINDNTFKQLKMIFKSKFYFLKKYLKANWGVLWIAGAIAFLRLFYLRIKQIFQKL